VALLLIAWGSAAGVKAEQATSRYTNAELVSINPQTRLDAFAEQVATRDLFNQVVGRGEAVKGGMVRAEEAARAANLVPGDLRATRRRHSMEWSGWGGPAPELLKR